MISLINFLTSLMYLDDLIRLINFSLRNVFWKHLLKQKRISFNC